MFIGPYGPGSWGGKRRMPVHIQVPRYCREIEL